MTAPAMALALVDGRARLTVERRELGPAVVCRVEVEWPKVGALPEGATANGLRNRRGRLRSAGLFVGGERLEQRASGATLPAGGITRLDVTLEKGRIAVSGRAEAGDRGADFTARLTVGAGAGRSLRIALEDVRIHGTPPLPVSAIAASALAILREAAATGRGPRMPGSRSTCCRWRSTRSSCQRDGGYRTAATCGSPP